MFLRGELLNIRCQKLSSSDIFNVLGLQVHKWIIDDLLLLYNLCLDKSLCGSLFGMNCYFRTLLAVGAAITLLNCELISAFICNNKYDNL